MKQKVKKRGMYIPGLHRGHQAIAEAFPLQNNEFIPEGIPVHPLPVRLKQPGGTIGGIIGIIFVFMKPGLPVSIIKQQQDLQDE